jgi:hypothetical protein
MYPVGVIRAASQASHVVAVNTDGTVTFTAPADVSAVEFRLDGDSGSLLATSAVTIIEATLPSACVSAQQPRQLVPEMDRVVATVGEQYYEATFPRYWVSGPVVLAGDEDGQDPFATDDALSLDVVRPDGTRASWSIDFSAQCTVITDSYPVDVSTYLQPGVNRVTIRMNDRCGTAEGNAPIFF